MSDRKVSTTKVTLVYQGALEFKAAFLNKVRLRFRSGKASFDTEPNTSHSLKWKIMGVPGAKWSWKLEMKDGFTVEPATFLKPQERELETPYQSLPADRFRIVPK